MTADHPVRPWYVCNGDPCTCKKVRSSAPDPSPYEQSEIDRFGIFDAEDRLALALQDASLDEGVVLVGYEPRTSMTAVGILSRESARRLAAAAIAALDRP